MTKIDKLIQKLELDYISKLPLSDEKKLELLPLTKKNEILALIWNLSKSESYKVSYKDYASVLEILINRLNKSK